MTLLSNAMYAAVVGSDRSAVYTASSPPIVVNVSDASMVGSALDIQKTVDLIMKRTSVKLSTKKVLKIQE